MKIRMPIIKTLMLSLLIGMLSCSGSEDENGIQICPPGTNEPYAKVTLGANPVNVKLYEFSEIRISTEKSYDISFDSVVWDMPGIFREVSKDGYILISMSQGFCLPGEYEVTASAFSKGDTLAVGSVKIFVSDNLGDFLGINWSSKESIGRGEIHYTSAIDNYSLFLEYVSGDPYALLHFKADTNDDEKYIEANTASRKLLSDYITKLYGKAQKVYEGEDITQSTLIGDYNALFSKDLNAIYHGVPFFPLALWQTDRANIALIAYNEGIHSCSIFKIIAQPLI